MSANHRLPPRGALGSVESARRYELAFGEKLRATRALRHYLQGEYQTLPLKLHSGRTASDTGLRLSDRIVSRLEVGQALQALEYRPRRCLELRFFEGLTVEEAAEILHCSTSTVVKETSQALALMARDIFEEGVT